MTKFWSFFLRKHHFTVFLMVALLAAGLYAVVAIPKESTPDISIPLGVIVTVLPGASSADVERLVTDKIESGVLGVEHVSKVTSTSGDGVSSVSVEFDSSANIDKSIQLLKDAVDKVRPDLPAEALAPTVSDVNFADSPILIVSISGDLAPEELTALGQSVSDEVKRVPGVSKVGVSGVRARQVQVIVKQAELAQYNLSLSDVTNAIRTAGVASPAGDITVDGVNYAVRFESGVTTTDQVANVAITGPGGVALHVSDVADVVDGLEDPTTYSRVSVAGKPANPSLTLTVYKSRGGNIVATGQAVQKKLEELKATSLSGTDTVISYNGADEVNKSLIELSRAGLETVALVMLILLLTLGWRESLVAAASIPLSFLVAFIGLLASGNTLNNVSLFSLILAIGILVDSGIVVVEAFHTRLLKYGNKHEAAVAAIREYAWPLIAGTFTTIVVFVPLFFLSGIIGKFLGSIPFTIIFVLLASIFVALGFVPLLAIFFVKDEHSQIQARQEKYNLAAKAWYVKFLTKLLHDKKNQNRFIIGMIVLFFLALALPATGIVKSIFFPSADSDYIYVEIEKPQGTALEETDLSVREVEEVLYANPHVASFVSEAGAGSSFASGLTGPSSGSNVGNITVNLPKNHTQTSAELVTELRKQLAPITSATITVGEPAGGPPSSSPITITFSGEDLNELTNTADNATHVLASIPGVVNIHSSTENSSAEFVVSLDSAKAAQLGVSPAVVADTLRTALFSAKATSIRAGKDDIEVHTKLDLNPNYGDPSETTHTTIDSVRNLTVPGAHGPVPLSTIANITYEPAQSSISHEAGNRITTVTADVSGKTNVVDATKQFQKLFTPDKLGKGVTMDLGGATQDIQQSFTELFFALIAGAALMLTILILEFNSFRHSFYLLLIIPFSLIGVFLGLLLVGQPLSLTSMLGVIALAGVIINHAIILMDSIARIHREHPEMTLEEVVVDAASTRLRPILLTTVVTVIGMIPLAITSAFFGPLAVAIMFGLAFSLLLTLVLIPVLYYRWPGKAVRAKFDSRKETIE
ncbi:MAG TPA: efflux RND transporter permease subunit [Candidatus Paceibacterota bacterium]|nr:efflux RND transporter permease subunit [Candidatus Paceibacterota bacterium]